MTCYGGDYPFAAFGPEEHQFVARLMELGSVVWVGRKGWGRAEFTRPRDWQNLRRDGNEDRLATFEENQDCLCLNTGGEVVVVDVDTRNCGDIEKVRALLAELGVRIFAEVDTPGAGKHFYIAGHPDLPSVHSTEKNQRLPGYPGVDIQSFGCNVYLPGTGRPKYDGRGYDIVYDELDQLVLLDGDDAGSGALADCVDQLLASTAKKKARKTSTGASEWEWDPCEPWDGTPPDERQRAYLDAALTGEAENVAKAAKGGRNDALFVAALKCGSYVAGAGLDEQRVIAALQAAADTNGYTAEDGVGSTRATIRSGLRRGRKNPRAVPPPTEHGGEATGGDDQAGQEEAGAEGPTDAEDGARFFSRSGLLARDLADAVTRSVTCGFGYPDQRFYTYDGGVWLPDDGRIEGEITRLLGNRYRSAHTRSVLDLIQHSPSTMRITDNPLAECVNVPNGMVAWKTGDLLPHSPDYRSTVQLPVEYDADARCPLFEKFVAEVLPKDLYEQTDDVTGFHLGTHRLHPLLGQPAARRRPAARQGPQRQGHADPGAQGAAGRPQLLHGGTAPAGGEPVPRRHAVREARQPRRRPRLQVARQHRHVQGDHRRGHRPGRVQVRCRVRLHAVGAAVLLDQQGVRLSRLLGGVGGAVGGGAVPDELPWPRRPDTGRQAAAPTTSFVASCVAASRRCRR